MMVFSCKVYGWALVTALVVYSNLLGSVNCEEPKSNGIYEKDSIVEDRKDSTRDSRSAAKRTEVSEHSQIMFKLKNTVKGTDKLLNSVLGDLLMSPRRNTVDGAEESVHTGAKDVKDTEEFKFEANRSGELDEDKTMLNTTRNSKNLEVFRLSENTDNIEQSLSKLEIAWKVLLGELKRNLSEAKESFDDLARTGDPSAHMALGFLHAAGIAEAGNQGRALVHYMLGALGGNLWSLVALGYKYKTGTSVARNCEKSLQFYEKAAKSVVKTFTITGSHVVHRVRLVDLEENGIQNTYCLESDLMHYYEYLAAKGDVIAQVTLGRLYFDGLRGCPKDLKRAKYFFDMASERNHPVAWGYLGNIYLEEADKKQADYSLALDLFKKAAKYNNPVGLTGLGMMYLGGRGVEMDLKRAKHYFLQASDMGWSESQLQLGVMYLNGVGVKRDFRSALKYLHMAAQSGHVLAYYYLAEMHSHGFGILRSCHVAVELYKNVVERGKWSEYLVTGYQKFQSGEYFPAFVVYALLAELGYEVAQSNAAYLLEKGLSGLQITDDERYFRAFNYWRRSAQQGYSQAHVKMGDYYYYGNGVPRDFEAAASQYRLASNDFGNPLALFNIGYMHEHGLGIARDLALAKRFYDLAATVSPGARVPVYLSLVKLGATMALEFIVSEIPELFSDLAKQWRSGDLDIYVLFFLVSSLLFLLTLRA